MKATLWYTNKRIDVNSIEEWVVVPESGIICIIEYFDNGTSEIHANHEFYYWNPQNKKVETTKGYDTKTSCPPPYYAIGVKRAPEDMLPYSEYEVIKDAAMAETI